MHPEKIHLKDGIGFTIKAAISNVAVFNHYIVKEYAPKAQGGLSMGKNPAKHTLANCLYDEISGWLDSPTVTGISILDICVDEGAFKNMALCPEPRVHLKEIVEILYDTCKLDGGAPVKGEYVLIEKQKFDEIKQKMKLMLKSLDKVELHGTGPEEATKVGAGVRKRRIPG